MSYTLLDLAGLTLATLAHGLLVLLPGVAIAHWANTFGFRRVPPFQGLALGLVVAYAILPVVDSIAARVLGLDAALALNLALAGAGVVVALRRLPLAIPRAALAAAAAWLLLIALSTVDFEHRGALHISLLMIDTVKHAATVQALLDAGGAPPLDPFFLRDDPAGYYYYFYVASALVARLGLGLLDARAAFAGQIFWTGLALVSLLHLLAQRTGLARALSPLLLRRALPSALLVVGGLQILPVALIAAGAGVWLAQTAWWGEQVTSFPLSVLWVPHHVAGLIACWTGLLLLVNAIARGNRAPHDRAKAVALAASAFASAAGLSIWVTATACAAIAAWLAVLALERRWQALGLILAAGLGSILLSLPYLWELVHFRAQAAFPVALHVRGFHFTDAALAPGLAQTLARIAMLPLGYALEFGLLALGAAIYWRDRAQPLPVSGTAREARRVLALTGLAGLLVATFCKSTVISNDLGWRGVLFAQVAATLWSLAAFAPLAREALGTRRLPRHELARVALVAALLGVATVGYDLTGLRAYAALGLGGIPDIVRDHAIDRDLRRAYEALAASPEAPPVLQHNPDADRTFAYGLYGRARVAVSDRHNGMIFGAAPSAVHMRVADIVPIFQGALAETEARRRLAVHRIGALVVTRADPLWQDEAAWIWSAPVLFATANVRVVRVGEAP